MGIRYLLLCFVLTAVTTWGRPVFWKQNDHFYERVRASNITWAAANEEASVRRFMGTAGHLVTITSQEENDFVYNLHGEKLDHYWIGGFKPDTSVSPSSGWQWVTGEPFQYSNWLTSPYREPNNNEGCEDAIEFHHVQPGQWNDYAGGLVKSGGPVIGYIQGYIVEYPVNIFDLLLKVLLGVVSFLFISACGILLYRLRKK